MIVEFTEVNNILLQWLCFFSLRSQTCGKKPKPKGFLTVLFPINVRSRSLMIWPLLQFKSGWFYFYVLIPWSFCMTYLICQAICLCLTTFSASRASQFRTDKVIPRFFDDLMKQKWSGRIFCKNDYHKWLDSKSFEAHWKWKCFYVFKISSSRVVDSVWFDNNILKLVR